MIASGVRAIAVILAAGAGRRLGGVAKALLPGADQATFLAEVVARAGAAGVDRALVVVGPPHGDAVAAEARRLGIGAVWNHAPERGMGSSVAAGFAAAAEDARLADLDVALLWPVDHARVSATTVAALLARAARDRVIVPVWQGRGGHPAAIGRDLWPAMAACAELPEGARSVLRGSSAVERIEVDDPGVVADVDLPHEVGARPGSA